MHCEPLIAVASNPTPTAQTKGLTATPSAVAVCCMRHRHGMQHTCKSPHHGEAVCGIHELRKRPRRTSAALTYECRVLESISCSVHRWRYPITRRPLLHTPHCWAPVLSSGQPQPQHEHALFQHAPPVTSQRPIIVQRPVVHQKHLTHSHERKTHTLKHRGMPAPPLSTPCTPRSRSPQLRKPHP